MDKFKKVMKVVGIIVAVVGAIVGIYFAVKKAIEKKQLRDQKKAEMFVSTNGLEPDFLTDVDIPFAESLADQEA